MNRRWTFGRKVGSGFAAVVALSVAVAVIGSYELDTVASAKDRVIRDNAETLIQAQLLRRAADEKSMAARGYLLTRDAQFLSEIDAAHGAFVAALQGMRGRAGRDDALPARLALAEGEHQRALEQVLALRRTDAPVEGVARRFDDDVLPKREALNGLLDELIQQEKTALQRANEASTRSANRAGLLLELISAAAVLLAVALAVVLSRSLSKQIGTAVHHVQSSSAELQAAANQQAAGAKEQATAMSEITTTISELLATSRQIAQSAQRVAKIATETASAARSGDQTLSRAQEAVATIRRQVDLIVTHMVDLGKKSQQIGGVLELINELAEQTNILAINATIEAAGAGESGKRFAVVADEIRKLADRVGGSTKEIRGMIEEIRAAVNTTVMTTESGTKAVEVGGRGFAELTASFRQIAGLVETTTEAAREIELSTTQQTSAVEQVNVAQATRETETSSTQTLQTASQLTGLSRDLSQLVQPNLAA